MDYQKRTTSGRALSTPMGLLYGTAASMLITLLGAVVLAWLINLEKLQWEQIGYGIMVLLLTASFLGALAAYHKIKRQRMMVCILAGLLYLAVLASLTALFFGGQYEGVGVSGCLIAAGNVSAGILGLQTGKGRISGNRKRRHR